MNIRSTILVALLFTAATSASELHDPVPILVGGKPLDVERMGHAAPFVADFDGDGLNDLLVGEFYKGRLRIYRNVGANREPQFDDFTLFQNGDRSGCIHASCCMGFGPQMIDFDGDGHQDILSGNWLHEIILFRGLGDGSFSPGAAIKDRDDKPINVGYGVTAFAADWDADGDLDLLAGTVEHSKEGNVYLVRNEGSAMQHAFAEPERISADGAPIVATDGGAAPVAADWDGDGRLDLILGCGDGSVRWYRNVGSGGSPEFSSFVNVVEPASQGSDRGSNAKVCVTDWNDDGQLDLLVGDAGERFEKQPTAEETQWRDEAKQQQAAFFAAWAEGFARYRQLAAAAADRSQAAHEEHERQLAALREELARLSAVRARFREQEESLEPGTQRHGRVWLFLNRGSESQAAADN